MLETLNFPMENYYEESFGGSSVRSPKNKSEVEVTKAEAATVILLSSRCSEPDYIQHVTGIENPAIVNTAHQSPRVVFTKSGKEISCDSDEIILEIAEQEGIKLPFGCRMGACGACKLPLLAGEVNYDDEPVCEPGYLLSCIAKANGRVVIEA